MSKILAVDVHNLCWRSWHSTGHLTEGLAFGFLKELQHLRRLLRPDRVAFCFDSMSSKRREILPTYKLRQSRSPQEQKEREGVIGQIDKLRRTVLPKLGFRNLFIQHGYEADDLIASVCLWNRDFTVVIASTDQDLYQLLSRRVSMWKAGKPYTDKSLLHDYGIPACHWVAVKCMAGCRSDNIPGVPGIGEKSAIRYILRTASPRIRQKIDARFGMLLGRNLPLVNLPFDGTMKCRVVPDEATPEKWDKVVTKMGMKSLANVSMRMVKVRYVPTGKKG